MGSPFRSALAAGASAVAFVLAAPAVEADIAYVAGFNQHMISLDTVSGRQGAPVLVDASWRTASNRNEPRDIVIAPDGRTVYALVGDFGAIRAFDTTTSTVGTEIEVPHTASRPPMSLAISPDGRTLLVTDDDGVTAIDTTTGKPVGRIPVFAAREVAFAPDGRTAYVTTGFVRGGWSQSTFVPIDLATQTAGTEIPLATARAAMAITPDGSTAVAVGWYADTIDLVDLKTGVTEAVSLEGYREFLQVAIAPDGKTAYLGETAGSTQSSKVIPFDLASRTLGAPVLEASSDLSSLAVTGDGKHVLATQPCPTGDGCQGVVVDRDLTTDAAPRTLPVSNLTSIEATRATPQHIVLAPSPSASFTAVSAATGSATTFDASDSGNSGGSITGYAWQFGDGTTGTGPIASHVYTEPGTYTVTLTTTNAGGCATKSVYTGRMTTCTGSTTATATRTIQVASTPAGARTASAASVSRTRAALRGTILAAGGPATYHFEYGTTNRYGRSTPEQKLPSRHGSVAVQATVTKLSPNRRYHYRLVVSTPRGQGQPATRSDGADVAFTTRSTGTLRLQSRTRRLAGSAVVLPLRCSSTTLCRGGLTLTATRGKRTITCATASVRVAANRTTRKRVHVRTACRSLLRSAKRDRLTTTVTASLRTGQKGPSGTVRLSR